MFTKRQLEKYADVLWDYGLVTARTNKYKKGDIIEVLFPKVAVDLADAIYRKIIDVGMNPVTRLIKTPVMEKYFYKNGDDEQLTFISPWAKKMTENLHGYIYIHAPESLTHLKNVPPDNISKTAKAVKFLRDIRFKRELQGDFGWTIALYPTEAMAKHAGLSIEDFTKEVVKACYLNKKDPVTLWKEFNNESTRLQRRLAKMDVEKLHMESNKCNLTITPGEGRQWRGGGGYNVPSFELFTSPDWRGTEGVFYADRPSYVRGNLVDGVELVFEKGKIVDAHAKKGNTTLQAMIDTDEGAREVGEFSLTDRRYSKIDKFMANTLYDENFGGKYGNCHIAIGASYPECYGGDQSTLTKAKQKKLGFSDSAIHWDLINGERKTVTAYLKDGTSKVIYHDGVFTI